MNVIHLIYIGVYTYKYIERYTPNIYRCIHINLHQPLKTGFTKVKMCFGERFDFWLRTGLSGTERTKLLETCMILNGFISHLGGRSVGNKTKNKGQKKNKDKRKNSLVLSLRFSY